MTSFEIQFLVTQLCYSFVLNLTATPKPQQKVCGIKVFTHQALLLSTPLIQVCLYFSRFSFCLPCVMCPSFPAPLALNSIIKSDLEQWSPVSMCLFFLQHEHIFILRLHTPPAHTSVLLFASAHEMFGILPTHRANG